MTSIGYFRIYERFCMREWYAVPGLNPKLISVAFNIIPKKYQRALVQKARKFNDGWWSIVKGNWNAIL